MSPETAVVGSTRTILRTSRTSKTSSTGILTAYGIRHTAYIHNIYIPYIYSVQKHKNRSRTHTAEYHYLPQLPLDSTTICGAPRKPRTYSINKPMYKYCTLPIHTGVNTVPVLWLNACYFTVHPHNPVRHNPLPAKMLVARHLSLEPFAPIAASIPINKTGLHVGTWY